MAQSAYETKKHNSQLHQYSYSSEEEDEQERLLSEQYGEASEVNTGNKKRKEAETDKDLERDFANDALAKKSRVSRPKFEPSNLIGPQGLIKIKNEFPSILKHQTSKLSKKKTTSRAISFKYEAEANYGKVLMSAYTQFFFELYPHLAFEDLLLRVEKFGTKREVKDFIEMMREDTRRFHVERVFGMEKADRMLKDLEKFQNMEANVFESDKDYANLFREDYGGVRENQNRNRGNRNKQDLDEGETEAVFDDEQEAGSSNQQSTFKNKKKKKDEHTRNNERSEVLGKPNTAYSANKTETKILEEEEASNNGNFEQFVENANEYETSTSEIETQLMKGNVKQTQENDSEDFVQDFSQSEVADTNDDSLAQQVGGNMNINEGDKYDALSRKKTLFNSHSLITDSSKDESSNFRASEKKEENKLVLQSNASKTESIGNTLDTDLKHNLSELIAGHDHDVFNSETQIGELRKDETPLANDLSDNHDLESVKYRTGAQLSMDY